MTNEEYFYIRNPLNILKLNQSATWYSTRSLKQNYTSSWKTKVIMVKHIINY